MKKHSAEILKEYDSGKFLYQEFGDIVNALIKSLIGKTISTSQINFRLKDRDSLSTKLIRKNHKYISIREITDIIGLRIVLYFEDDIDIIADVFKREFEIDFPNSIDKREVEADKFGYRSLHYVASLNKARLSLTEYKRFKGLKFEVQIRSILQHSWAEIEHDLGYKGESEIPQTAKRTFYRVAALLEQADIEFVKLKKEINEFEQIIKEQIVTDSSSITVNKSALIAFIKESSTLVEIENLIETIACKRGRVAESFITDVVLKRLQKENIKTLKELEDLLSINKDAIIDYVKKDYLSLPEPRPESFVAGASINWLLVLIEERADAKENKTQKTKPQNRK